MVVHFSDSPEFASWFQETFGIECGIMSTPNDVFDGVPVCAWTRYVDACISSSVLRRLQRNHGPDTKKIIIEALKLALQIEAGSPFHNIKHIFVYQVELCQFTQDSFYFKFKYGVIENGDVGD